MTLYPFVLTVKYAKEYLVLVSKIYTSLFAQKEQQARKCTK